MFRLLAKEKRSRSYLASRGIADEAVEGGTTTPPTRRSHPAWWDGFVLSGDVR
jgi:hypothetical protein